jgi:hypothetical protein
VWVCVCVCVCGVGVWVWCGGEWVGGGVGGVGGCGVGNQQMKGRCKVEDAVHVNTKEEKAVADACGCRVRECGCYQWL